MRRLLVAITLVASALALIPAQQALAAATCNGRAATKVGTAGANTIVGTNNADVIQASGGNDRVFGKGGNDLICGGAGNDAIDGQAGQDTIYGDVGRDLCVAPTAKEHQLHHACEVHLGNAPLGTPPPQSSLVAAMNAAKVAGGPSSTRIRRATSALDSPVASAGEPECNFFPKTVGYASDKVGAPFASTPYSNGFIAVSMEVVKFFDVSTGQWSYNGAYGPGPVTTYGPLEAGTRYLLPPTPARVQVDPNSLFVIFIHFNWYDGSNWTGWQWDKADYYTNGAIGASFTGRSELCSTQGG